MQHAAGGDAEVGRDCSHYSRGCRVLASCCHVWVGCRLCHNELFTDHEIDRHAIRTMQCLACDAVQPCGRECRQCAAVMGDYFCGVCNLFDNDGTRKKIFHCDDCGICRVGGRENFFHCERCCGCYPHSLNNRHRCVDGSMHRECAICLERTFDSLQTVNVLACGHVLHHSCYREYVRYGNVVCPTCRTSLLSPRQQEQLRVNTTGVAEVDGDDTSDGESESDESDQSDDVDSVPSDDDGETDDIGIDADVLRAVVWEDVGENDVEGLDDSDEEEETETVRRHR